MGPSASIIASLPYGSCGLTIVGGVDTAYGALFVSEVDPSSPVFGLLSAGDRLISISGHSMLCKTSADIYGVLGHLEGFVQIDVQRLSARDWKQLNDVCHESLPGTSEYLRGISLALGVDLLVSSAGPLATGELRKADFGNNIGMRLVGGKGTPFGGIFVTNVHQNGAAAGSGVLEPGFRLLEINGESLLGVTREQAIERLHQHEVTTFVAQQVDSEQWAFIQDIVPFSGTVLDGYLNMVMFSNTTTSEVGVTLAQIPGSGVVVREIETGSIASNCGLQSGDFLISIGFTGLLRRSADDCTRALESVREPTRLLLLRGAFDPQFLVAGPDPRSAMVLRCGPQFITQETSGCIFHVNIRSDLRNGPGFTVIGGGDTPFKGLFVDRILPGSPAAVEGHLTAGDRILEINGHTTIMARCADIEYELSRSCLSLVAQHLGAAQFRALKEDILGAGFQVIVHLFSVSVAHHRRTPVQCGASTSTTGSSAKLFSCRRIRLPLCRLNRIGLCL
jgi:C-terminal processing protease CtpA/Prc